MSALTWTITPAAIAQLHDALSCLAKFDENISLDANTQGLRISSLNSSKTAYASFFLSSTSFFEKYRFGSRKIGTDGEASKSWACKLQNRALLSIFKKRQTDNKDKETSIERCEFELQAKSDETECRIVIKLFCKFSVIKTYRLTYEATEVLHATFDKQSSKNTWKIASRTMRDVVEYFGPKTEHVDWSLHDDKVTFTSYADKIQAGKEVIRQPIQTSVTLDDRDFDECKIEPDLHLSIPVKDFRSIIGHADTMEASIKATYSQGHRPAQFTYNLGGLSAEYTLMTKGTSSAALSNTATTTPARGLSVRPTTQSQSTTKQNTASTVRITRETPSVDRPSRNHTPTPEVRQPSEAPTRPKVPTSTSIDTSAPPASINPDSMFFPAAEDDDNQWDPQNYDDDQGMVTWETENVFDPSNITGRRLRDGGSGSASFQSAFESRDPNLMEIPPTQRLSQIKGLFD